MLFVPVYYIILCLRVDSSNNAIPSREYNGLHSGLMQALRGYLAMPWPELFQANCNRCAGVGYTSDAILVFWKQLYLDCTILYVIMVLIYIYIYIYSEGYIISFL